MATTALPAATAASHYAPPPRGGSYQNVLLAILFSTFGFVFFDRLALNFLTPYLKDDLGLSNTQVGLLGGVPSLTWALSGLCIGYLSDRVDRRKPFLIAAVVTFTVFSTLSGLVGGLGSLLLFRAVMGGAEGAVLPISQPLMLHSSTEQRRGLNMGLLQGSSAGLLGGVLGPLITVWVADQFGWRTAFYVTVVPGVLMAALILRYVRELRLGTGADDGGTGAAPEAVSAKGVASALRCRNIAVCLAIAVFYLTWFVTTQTFTPLYLDEVKGYDGGEMSFVLTGIGVAWVLWGALVPGLSDRIGRKPAMTACTALAVLAPVAIMVIDNPILLFVALILTYTGMGCFALFMSTIPAETVPRAIMATALGLISGLGEVVGGFVAPAIAGRLSDAFGLQAAMWVSVGAAAVVVALSLLLVETAPAKLARTSATVGVVAAS